ncbi:MAG: redoxin family protein [Hyphomicrobium sp.]
MWPYPPPPADGAADHLRSGILLPNIPLPSTSGNSISLKNMEGFSVVFVYPWTGRSGFSNPKGWDDIPGAHGSTAEAEGFRDQTLEYKKRGIALFGMSTQHTTWQMELSERLGLDFPLLSDNNFLFSKALDLPSFTTDGITFLKRLTLVCRDGKILHTFYPVHPPDSHASDILGVLYTFMEESN